MPVSQAERVTNHVPSSFNPPASSAVTMPSLSVAGALPTFRSLSSISRFPRATFRACSVSPSRSRELDDDDEAPDDEEDYEYDEDDEDEEDEEDD